MLCTQISLIAAKAAVPFKLKKSKTWINEERGIFARRGTKSWKTISKNPCLLERWEYVFFQKTWILYLKAMINGSKNGDLKGKK